MTIDYTGKNPTQERTIIAASYATTATFVNVCTAFAGVPDVGNVASNMNLSTMVTDRIGLLNTPEGLFASTIITAAFRSGDKQNESADKRTGTDAQTDYLLSKMEGTPVDSRALAAIAMGTRHGLKQNIITQWCFSNPLLAIATAVDIGGGILTGAKDKGKVWGKRFGFRNTTKAFLMDMGLIAPAGQNIAQITDNCLLPTLSEGRVAWEKKRVAAARAEGISL